MDNQGCLHPPSLQGYPDRLPAAVGGDRVLLHFVQKSPGDYVPQETILQALGISAEGCASESPQVSLGLWGGHCPLRTAPTHTHLPWVECWVWPGVRLDVAGFREFCAQGSPGCHCQPRDPGAGWLDGGHSRALPRRQRATQGCKADEPPVLLALGGLGRACPR